LGFIGGRYSECRFSPDMSRDRQMNIMRAIVVAAAAILAPSIALGDVKSTADSAAAWQLAHSREIPGGAGRAPAPETDWTQAAFYIGLSKWAAVSGQEKYFTAIRAMGDRAGWQLGHLDWGPPIYYADDHAIGQVYIAAFDRFGERNMIDPLVQRLEYILQNPPKTSLQYDEDKRACMARWCWSDALFMAPATWFGIARIQKDRRFRDYADKEFWATKDVLFDKDEHLYYRDSRFIGKAGAYGEKVFWSRGNGWAIAGLANVLREMAENDPARGKYESLLAEIAERLATLQRPDGFWSTSLLAPADQGVAESSGTGFITYAMAAGVNMGILDSKRFFDVVERGWKALQSVTVDGKLGRVQQIGEKPEAVQANGSQFYGTGALLLTASELERDLAEYRGFIVDRRVDGVWMVFDRKGGTWEFKTEVDAKKFIDDKAR